MKKLIALFLTVILMAAVLTGCGEEKTDWEYIEEKGKLVIGITLFNPMNYKEANGELTGFETEFAKAVCAELGLTPDFQVIDWNSKETELSAKKIDCIWNGMTIDEERSRNMDISTPYMSNKQVMVVKSENKDKYADTGSIADARIVAEQKSAGEKVAKENQLFGESKYTAVDAQSKVLMEIASGTADIGLIDYVMTIGSIGENTDYSDLVVMETMDFNPEEYGIAFRKNSPVTLEKFNDAIRKLASQGKIKEIADKYKLTELLLV